jgi:predicted ATP-dependent protease
MDEILELRHCIEEGRYGDALLIIDEMDEMAKDDKLNKIHSYAVVLLIHLIKQRAERRTTRSWDVSIRNTVRDIQRVNKRRKAGGHYALDADLHEALQEAFAQALEYAAQEAFEGRYDDSEIASMIDKDALLDEAFRMIQPVP